SGKQPANNTNPLYPSTGTPGRGGDRQQHGYDGYIAVVLMRCPPGYGDSTCSTEVDECKYGRCQNGSSCTDGVDSYTCGCLAGYDGDDCEININECAGVTCVHGTCVDGVD